MHQADGADSTARGSASGGKFDKVSGFPFAAPMYVPMGYERDPAPMRSAAPEDDRDRVYLYLDDVSEFVSFAAANSDDGEAEVTWPEMIDQTRLTAATRACGWDDAEEDDHAGGNVTDDPHDVREEDGI